MQRTVAAILLALAVPMAAGQLSCVALAAPKVIIVHVHILPNGDMHYRYDGKDISEHDYMRLSDDATKRHQEVDLDVTMDKPAKGSVIARIMEAAKRNGATHIGFTGIDQHK